LGAGEPFEHLGPSSNSNYTTNHRVLLRMSFFHVDCYKCKKCQNAIGVDDQVFLDLDGLPLCQTCFHRCSACHLRICEKIIYVSEEAFYHPECFICKKCTRQLDERKFAKTTRSFYCLECHERRIMKIKKHQQKKESKEKVAYGGLLSPGAR